ncbi:RNA-directed DNA polymerase, eukaryota, reverse transcriptase zinc-binding domain protein [Tanacetum coccineum]
MMARNVKENPNFKYHKGCKDLKLTHLSFVDDLLVMSHGDCNSVAVVRDTLMEFSKTSSLIPNMSKSIIFFGSVDEGEKQRILDILPFKGGKLPIKYLGISLLAKKIGIKDCKVLVDRVKKKVNDWKNKTLSYAGRLQLIASVLAAMQTYWASVVMLPKATVKEINRVLKSFLWNKGKDIKGKEKLPGLWSVVLRLKVNKVKLKGKSFWEINVEQSDSGTWKFLIDLRRKVRQYIIHEIGDGRGTSMWYDNWHDIGPLSNFIDNRCLYDARLENDCKVADMFDGSRWKWPQEWYSDFPILARVQVPSLNISEADVIKWKTKKGQKVGFSTKQAWLDIKDDLPKVNWWKLVWYSQSNPRCAFILWMAIKGKILTQDRMMKWSKEILVCPLCRTTFDSHTHLFFQCEYSAKIYDGLKEKMKADNIPNDWDQIIQYMANLPCNNSIWSIVNKIILANAIYHIWKERNGRIFTSDAKSSDIVLQTINEHVRLQIMSLKWSKSVHTIKVAEWMRPFNATLVSLFALNWLAVLALLKEFSPCHVKM